MIKVSVLVNASSASFTCAPLSAALTALAKAARLSGVGSVITAGASRGAGIVRQAISATTTTLAQATLQNLPMVSGDRCGFRPRGTSPTAAPPPIEKDRSAGPVKLGGISDWTGRRARPPAGP